MTINIDVNSARNTKVSNGSSSSKSSGNYTVKQSETLYSLMKKFNFKNETEIRQYLKLSGTEQLKKGQSLTFPTVKLETTMSAIARKYNMSLKDLMVLNPAIKDASKVVKGQSVNVPIRPFAKTENPVATHPKPQSEPVKQTSVPVKRTITPQVKPQDIAQDLKESASKFGAVTSEKFINAFKKITSENVIDVIKAYDKISPDESLIKMICREVSNSKDSRKEAVMKLYNRLAQKVGNSVVTPELTAKFTNELNSQFDGWGLVSTEKLDEIIGNILTKANQVKEPNYLAAVAKKVGLSESFLSAMKKSEDAPGMKENEFHTTPYWDKNGNLTIGIGHLITEEEKSKFLNKEISIPEVMELFVKDLSVVNKYWKHLLGNKEYDRLPVSIKDAITDYMFNRGYGTMRKQTAFLTALKSQDYAKAISLMNVDYSYKKDKNGKRQVVYLTGLSKRRLFDMYTACKMYKGNIPAEVKTAIQNMYNRGIKHMQTEFPNQKERQAVLKGYNNDVKAWFGDIVQYK